MPRTPATLSGRARPVRDRAGTLAAVRVVSVNVSLPRIMARGGREVRTGILKEPVEGRVAVGRTNLAGDAQADRRVHGGPDKAVYAYPLEHYAHWRAELGREPEHAAFGENLSVEGMDEAGVLIGDRYRIGSALLEVAQPRSPCAKLALRMGDPAFGRRFVLSLRSGFYLRVIEEGELGAGDAVAREARGAAGVSVSEAMHVGLIDGEDVAGARRVMAEPALAAEWRGLLARRLPAAERR